MFNIVGHMPIRYYYTPIRMAVIKKADFLWSNHNSNSYLKKSENMLTMQILTHKCLYIYLNTNVYKGIAISKYLKQLKIDQ